MKTKSSPGFAIARILEIVIGIYFILGAIPKVMDIDKFSVQMAAYKVIESATMLEPAVLLTIFLEIALGMALVLGVRLRGFTILGLQGVIVVFSALILYAWQVHGLEDCGCFPIIKMSPPVSLFKNTLIFLSGWYILWQMAGKKNSHAPRGAEDAQTPFPGTHATTPSFLRKMVSLAVSVIVALSCVAYAWTNFDRVAVRHGEPGQESIFAQFEAFTEQGYFNLGEGLYLVAVMSTSCPECKEKVPELNDLYLMAGLPPIVALCYEDNEGDLEAFKALTDPIFPTHSLGSRALLYFSLIDKDPFRLLLIQDGEILTFWDGDVPVYEEITLALDLVEDRV